MLILLLDSYNGFNALTVLIERNSRFLRMIFFHAVCITVSSETFCSSYFCTDICLSDLSQLINYCSCEVRM